MFKTNQIIFNAVTFKLVGYDKRKLNNAVVTNKNQEIPEKQVFMLPNQVNFYMSNLFYKTKNIIYSKKSLQHYQ